MDGYQYERKCAGLLKAKGFSDVQVTPGSGDQGIDVIAYQSKKKYGVQCKYYEGTVGNKAVQEVYAGAAYYNCDVALVITNSTLTKPAKELANKLEVEVWENIDAIYLQKHTAEYIEQQRVLQQQMERRRKQEEERERKLALEKEAKAEKLAKEMEESGELDQKRQYIQYAKGLIGISPDGKMFAYVKPDGAVVSCSYKVGGPGDTSQFHNIQSIVCTYDGIIGLRYDGSCMATKPPSYLTDAHIGECNHWNDIIAIAAGDHQIVGLRKDGTCVANSIKWNIGYGYDGQSDVSEWRDIVQIECGGNFSLGIQSDGHVVFAGKSHKFNINAIAQWSDIKMIAAINHAVVGLTKEGKLVSVGNISIDGIKPEKGILQLRILGTKTYALYADGSVGCSGEGQRPTIRENNIISMVSNYDFLCALDRNGKIHEYGLLGRSSLLWSSIPTDIRIFDSYDQALAESKIKKDRREQGLCQFCGGTFKGFFVQKCSKCGKRKDY